MLKEDHLLTSWLFQKVGNVLKAINCEGETKNKHFIADLLINTIQ